MRFTIEGIEPFVASKGWLVQVPLSERVSDGNGRRPAVAPFEVNVANATRMYPLDETPVAVPGKTFLPVRVQGGEREVRRPQ